jgi:hypothetical protein
VRTSRKCPAFPLVILVVARGPVVKLLREPGSCRARRNSSSSPSCHGQSWRRCSTSWCAERAIRAGVLISWAQGQAARGRVAPSSAAKAA